MNKLSIGARLAWQIASWEAVFTKYQYIEKEHLFIGLLSLQKMKEVDKTLKISQGECQKLNSEKKALDDIFQGLGINITAVRRRLRKSLPKGSFDHKSKIIHRSEECRYIFKRASELVIANVDADVLNILTAILAKPDSIITKCLQDFGVKPKKMWLRTISFETIDEKQTITLDMGKDDFKHIRTFTRRSDVSFLTIMFDDIVSSTALFHKMGDEDFLELIKFHDDTLKNIVKKSGKGEIIKSTGDGLLMVFSSPSVAVKCALEMQKKFLTHQYLKIRIGMDMGEVRKIMDDESRDIFGLKVSTANRITDAALGGHILTSKSVFEEAKKELSDTSIEWKFLGSQSFKPGEPTIDIFEAFHPRFLGRPMSDLSLRIKQKKRESIFIFPTKTPLLDKYGRDLTREAKYGKINPFIGRNDELFNILDILSKKESRNVLLIGLVGVGKSAIVEAVAMNLIDSRGKNQFSRKRLISLNFAKMMSGVKDEREFKSRLKNMFDEAKKESDVILYIDEIHNFIGAGNKNGYMNVTNIFKPAILKHEIQVIGTTTADSFKKYIESDRELMKSFQKIVIEEPSKEETFAILKTFQNKLEEYHQVWITDKALEAAIKLSMQFDPEHNLPAKAIDLMDEAGAHVHIADLHLDGQTILNELSIAKTLSGKLGIPLNKIILSMDN